MVVIGGTLVHPGRANDADAAERNRATTDGINPDDPATRTLEAAADRPDAAKHPVRVLVKPVRAELLLQESKPDVWTVGA